MQELDTYSQTPASFQSKESRREAILEAIAFAAEKLLRAADWRIVLAPVLARLGGATGASRVYLCRYDRNAAGEPVAVLVGEWCEGEVERLADARFREPFPLLGSGFEKWYEHLQSGRPVVHTSFEPGTGGVHAAAPVPPVALVPVVVDDRTWGCLGLTDFDVARSWSDGEIEGLVTGAGLIGGAIRREGVESELRASEKRFKVLVDNVPATVYLCRNDDRYTMLYLSDDVEPLTGLAAADFIADRVSFVDLFHPDDAAAIAPAVEAALAERRPFHLEYRLLHADGGWRWIEERGQGVLADDGTLQYLEGSLVDITERKKSEQRLVHDALHDPLTGLPNRVLLLDRLQVAMGRAQRSGRFAYAVMFVDLDDFKLVNDSLGHMAGDQLLVAVGRRLGRCLRPGDTVARFGGDEFAILLEDLAGAAEARSVVQEIQRELTRPFTVDDREIYSGACIGIAPGDRRYHDPEEVVRDADTAMYAAKELGPGSHLFFDPPMHDRAVHRLRIESALRRALERDELTLHYQPIVDLESGRISGAEALLRWRRDDGTLLKPEQFLEAAARIGLLPEIGHWVLDRAAREASDWCLPDAMVNVNLHALEFLRSDLVERVESTLATYGLPGSRLCVEITEHLVMQEPERAGRILHRLRDLGVVLALDDFGRGYSSLSYLQRFPIQTLKIDRTFIARSADERGRLLVGSLHLLADALGLVSVAEGVETDWQLTAVRECGYRLAQGHLFARPLPGERFASLLASAPRW